MHNVTFRTNVDAAKRLVASLNDRVHVRHTTLSLVDRGVHANLNPLVGDLVVLHRESRSGKVIRMRVCGRTWEMGSQGTDLEIELTTPHSMSITQFTDHVKDCGFPG